MELWRTNKWQKIGEVCAITATSVTVEIAELAEDLVDANVVVKDAAGNVVATTAKDLNAGSTEATFNFESPLTVNPTSQWTVNGVAYEVSEFDIVDVESLTRTGKYIRVTFNSPIDSLDFSEVKVRDKNTLEAYGVQSVDLSSDKMSAQVTMLGDDSVNPILTAGDIYTLSITKDGEATSADFEIPAVEEEVYVEAIDAEERTIDLRVPSGTLVLNVPEDMTFDFQEALGREMTVWYDKDGDVTKYVLSDQTVKYDAIEIITKDGKNYVEFKSDDSESRIDNAVAGTFTDIVEAKIDGANLSSGNEYEYAKVVFNDSNRVEAIVYVQAFDGEILVENTDGDIIQGYEDEINLEDYTIVKDGKTISVEDIEAGDMVSYNVDADYAEVYNNTVSGTIDGIYDGSFEIDGEVYDITKDGKTARVIEDGEIRALEQDDLEALQEGGEVTLNLDRYGRVSIVNGSFGEVVTAKSENYLSEDALVYYEATRGTMEVEYKTSSGEDMVNTFRLSQLEEITVGSTTYEVGEKIGNDKIDGFKYTDGSGSVNPAQASIAAIAAVRADGVVIQDNVLAVSSLSEGEVIEMIKDQDGKIVGLELDNTKTTPDFGSNLDDQLELTDTFVEVTSNNNKKISSNTTVFVEEVEDGTTTVTATTWGELSGFSKIRTLDVYWKDSNVEYMVIDKADTNSEKELKSSKALLTEVLLHPDTTDVARVKAFVDGSEVVYNVAKSDEIDSNGLTKGALAEIVIDENTGNVDELKVAANTVTGGAFDVNTAAKEFSIATSGTAKVDLVGSSDLQVYEMEGTSIKSVGISNLSTAANDEYQVTAYRSAAGSDFIDIVVIDKDTNNTNGTAYSGISEAIADDMAALTADDIKNANSNLNNVKTNLTVPAVGEVNAGTSITWDASANSAVDNAGVVTRPAYDATVALPNVTGDVVATLANSGVSEDKTFNVTVIAQELEENATATVAIGDTATNLNGGVTIETEALVGLLDDEGNTITGETIDDFTVTEIAAGTDVTLTTGTDDGTQSVELSDDGTNVTLTTTGIQASDVFDLDVTLTDAAGNTVTVTITVTAS